MAVVSDFLGRVAGMIDKNFLRNKENATCVLEPIDVESAVVSAEFHQVDARQIAGSVVEEHVFGAWVARINSPTVRASVPCIDRGIVLHCWVATLPGALGHAMHYVASPEFRALLRL